MKITDFFTDRCWDYDPMPDGTVEIFDPVTGHTGHVIPAFLSHLMH